MHASILHVLSERLTRESALNRVALLNAELLGNINSVNVFWLRVA